MQLPNLLLPDQAGENNRRLCYPGHRLDDVIVNPIAGLKPHTVAIENIGKLEVSKLEKNISILGIVAGIAPMLGFVGTISGVIRIFYNISLTDNISMGTIAGGLYEKMITSASGLIIGILAYVAYHVLNIMVDRVILKMETDAVEFIDLLEEPGR